MSAFPFRLPALLTALPSALSGKRSMAVLLSELSNYGGSSSLLGPRALLLPTTLVALLCLGWSADVAAAQESAEVATTTRFELRSDPEVALHHFLITWASAEAGEWPGYALQLEERDAWRTALNEAEQRSWSNAVQAYGSSLQRSLLFDAGLLAVRAWAAGAIDRTDIPTADQALADAIVDALPIYQRHWWSNHDERNRAWITAVAPTLLEVERQMISRVAAAYGGSWPDERIPVDVMVYANPDGAYSTAGRLTISSVPFGNQMPHAIEMIFHEASHMDPLEQPLRAAVDEAFAVAGGMAPDRFWHDVIFYTSGEVTRVVLAERGEPDYQHYGTLGVYRRGERWRAQLPVFEARWRPFLESGSNDDGARRAALEAIAVDLMRSGRDR